MTGAIPSIRVAMDPLDAEALSYTWRHPDPRMDALQREVQALVERAATAREPIPVTFAAIRALARERLDEPVARVPALVGATVGGSNTGALRRARRPVPHLSEPWFC